MAEESEIEADIDSLGLDGEPNFEKPEPAQPVKAPAEPEPEPQPGRTSCFLLTSLDLSLLLFHSLFNALLQSDT